MSDIQTPYLNGHMYQFDLCWIIQKIMEFETELSQAIDLRTIHYADPIQWDITTQYAPNTVVVDAKTGTAYISKKAVSSGILLTNEDYWSVIFNYQEIYTKIMEGVAFYNGETDYASKTLLVNDLVWYGLDLYRVTRGIEEGGKLIPGTNLVETSIESLLSAYYGRDRTAQILNDTLNVTGDYTLNAGDISETADNKTVKINKDFVLDTDGNLSESSNSRETTINADSWIVHFKSKDVNLFPEESDVVTVRTEADFAKNGTTYILGSDVTLTKPIETFKQGTTIDLNGFTITVSSSYIANYIAKTDDSAIGNSQSFKTIKNGKIDFNNKNVSLIQQGYTWRTNLDYLVCVNMAQALITYTNPSSATGAELSLNNVTLFHGDNNYAGFGLDIRFGDSSLINVYVIYFKKGVFVHNGSKNYYYNVHVWGYPKTTTNEYSDNLITNIGFEDRSADQTFINCYADTCEPIDISKVASYDNGGVGFVTYTNNITFIGCNSLVHNQTNNSNHLGFLILDTSPESGLANYERNINLIACYVNYQSGAPFKGLTYSDTKGTARTYGCFNQDQDNHLGQSDITFHSGYQLSDGRITFYRDKDSLDFNLGISKEYIGYIPPYIHTAVNNTNDVKSDLTYADSKLSRGTNSLVAVDNILYFYNHITKKFIKITGEAVDL